MFEFLSSKYRYITSRHNIPYHHQHAITDGGNAVTSVVIPCTGEDYCEEALLSATFAARFAPAIQEIVIVTDQGPNKFPSLPPKTRVVTLRVDTREEPYQYKQIYRSRLIKMQAPLQALTDGILMIDSDLNLLQMPEICLRDNHIYASFRQGKMINKLDGVPKSRIPAYYRDAVRPQLVDHVNGAFLAATRKTWQLMCPVWIAFFIDTWSQMADDQPPTDQLPLGAMLDTLDIRTVNLGDWMNWPVSKKIGGHPAVIPSQVVGAHGGFPLSEWQKYLASPRAPLLFKAQDYTRKVRYLTDKEKLSQ
ncbi:hypothetical protein [Biostraticola tofi]|uniref:Glycosyl transferase family 8 n=1 Tax=Biostraticola tofi TaxID=466109 RepID=A0A4R3YQJ8_9GAMM|nr:hypothetical protein [Biostraticola tofi]TCV93494.1 hypothetical protein EDC52_10950 [Biostraticola tofi]